MVQMKKTLLLVASIFLLSASFALTSFRSANAATAPVLFSDDFNSPQLDNNLWSVQLNVNSSGYPAYGGTIQVSDSAVSLSSYGSSFPCVTSAVNPFPESGDFAIDFDIAYTQIGGWGDGLWISNGQPFKTISVLPNPNVFGDTIFAVWSDDDYGNPHLWATGVHIFLLGNLVENLGVNWTYPGPTTSQKLTFKLEYTGGTYEVFLNGAIIASAISNLRPDTVGFGHPECNWVPFANIGPWSSFEVDHIGMLKPSSVSVNTSASTTQLGFSIDINGTLTDADGVVLPGKSVALSFLIPALSTWNSITSTETDANGTFSASWLPTATGTFILKAEWAGDDVYSQSADSENISVLRGDSQSIVFAQSNSTLSSLDFNSTSNIVSFSVSGPSGTTGYVKLLVSKELVSNVTALQVYLDGQPVTFTAVSIGDLECLSFSYGHSTHSVLIALKPQQVPEFAPWILLLLLPTTVASAVMVRKKLFRENR
jgi:hypothetical protein